jgi:hypothetical protein
MLDTLELLSTLTYVHIIVRLALLLCGAKLVCVRTEMGQKIHDNHLQGLA